MRSWSLAHPHPRIPAGEGAGIALACRKRAVRMDRGRAGCPQGQSPTGRDRARAVPAVCHRGPAQAGEGEETGQAENPGHQTRWVQFQVSFQSDPSLGALAAGSCVLSCSNSCFFLVLCFSLGIYTSYKTFLHKDKTLIKRLLKVSTSHPVLGGKTVPRARSEQAQLCKGTEFAVWDGLVHTGTRSSCQV